MPKKIDETDVKKECPSCGLGVSLESRICEFCGWDFEEEDEWILQIEKLERDLMLEKQKFEPGTVNDKIESTLHTPALERREGTGAPQKIVVEEHLKEPEAAPPSTPVDQPKKPVLVRTTAEIPPTKAPEPKPIMIMEEPEPVTPGTPPPRIRKVRSVKVSSIQAASGRGEGSAVAQEGAVTRTRLVRKVKPKS